MGNIQAEVWPIRVLSFFIKELRDVNAISMHQPAKPHRIKFFRFIKPPKHKIIVLFSILSYNIDKYTLIRR